MEVRPDQVIQALIQSELLAERRAGRPRPPGPPVVTLSRVYGSNGEVIGREVAARLGVEFYSSNLIDQLVEVSGIDPESVRRLDESVRGLRNSWLLDLIEGHPERESEYLHALTTVTLGIMHKGGVIVGRGSCFILAHHQALRARIIGSVEVCAGRISEREGLGYAEAARKVRKVDADRAGYIRRLFDRSLENPLNYHILLNSDLMAQEQIVDLLVESARQVQQRGLPSVVVESV